MNWAVVAPNKPPVTIEQTNKVLSSCAQAGSQAAAPRFAKAKTLPDAGDMVGGGILAFIANGSNPYKLAIGVAGLFKSQIDGTGGPRLDLRRGVVG